ncbi:hypothetical protein C805_01141 [Eubacterium sp. 14-2]|uniref:hypothetical protein n=1 Tax=Eubacterium sp. 14-2 TaxID=1235790 RepID=UPI000340CA35|nr:hypothetical protein [Eubacterium sp. 14-2]EOT27038.1 hypothetical protein C805_01141 [Eubacterium sp. 14-2]
MSIHRTTFKITCLVAVLSLGVSFCLCTAGTEYEEWFESISTGVFSSAVLLMFSSLIGYCIEEKRNCNEYYWNLIKLRSKALVLSTIPQKNNTGNSYYEAVMAVNELLAGFFATFDRNFIFKRRKKIQKILEIHYALYIYKNLSLDAELYIRQYMNDIEDENGEKLYSKDKLHKDIKDFCVQTDNFLGEGKPFVVYLDNKIREFQMLTSSSK